MLINMVGAFVRNAPFGTEIAFAKGMEKIGHRVNRIDPDYPHKWEYGSDATLVFKWLDDAMRVNLERCSGIKIVYQPDDARFPHIEEMLRKMQGDCDFLLTFDEYGVDLGRRLGYRDCQKMLLTADPELYSPNDSAVRDIDVSFVGSLTYGANHASRLRMCQEVVEQAKKRKWQTFIGPAYFNDERWNPVQIYRHSKVVLNHATDVGQPFGTGYGLQCRHFEVAMTRTPLLTNMVFGGCPLPCDIFMDMEGLVDRVEHIRSDFEAHAKVLYDEVMAHHRPEHRAVELTEFISRNS